MKIVLEDDLLEKIDTINQKIQKKISDPYALSKLAELNRAYRSLLKIQRDVLMGVYEELCETKPITIDYKNHQIKSITIQRERIVIESDKGAYTVHKDGGLIETEKAKLIQLLCTYFQMNEEQKDHFFSFLYQIIKHKEPLLNEAVQESLLQNATALGLTKKAMEVDWVVLHQKNYYVSKSKRETLDRLIKML